MYIKSGDGQKKMQASQVATAYHVPGSNTIDFRDSSGDTLTVDVQSTAQAEAFMDLVLGPEIPLPAV